MSSPTITPLRRTDGPALRAAREIAGFQQAQVARAAQISPSFYYRLETGERTTSNPQTIAVLAALLDVPVKQITRPAIAPSRAAAA